MNNHVIDNDPIRQGWNAWADEHSISNAKLVETIRETPHRAFPTAVWNMLNKAFSDFKGIRVCVPSSGDNLAAFAFHLLGAEVTSCDFSEGQLNNARRIAELNHWNMTFLELNSMNLAPLKRDTYDLVYTSNGVHVWISDLTRMYKEFHRILKPDGKYIMFETHPFIRPFDDSTNELKISKAYVPVMLDGKMTNYHWRVQDMVNSMIQSGLTIRLMEELFAEKEILGASWWTPDEWDEKADVKKNPYAALPQWIAFSAIK